MIRGSWTTEISRPVEEVFDYVADLDNEPQWNPDVSSVRKTTDGPIGEGTVFEEEVARTGHYVVTVDRYDRPREVGFDARNARMDALVRFRFTPAGIGVTQVDCNVELTPHGFMRLLEPLLRRQVEKGVAVDRPRTFRAALGEPEPERADVTAAATVTVPPNLVPPSNSPPIPPVQRVDESEESR